MVSYEIVASVICANIGTPSIVNMEDGYACWINPESKCSVVFCNWDICGDDISTQCELRIDSVPDNCPVEEVVLNGLNDDELYEAARQFVRIAINEYGF